MSETLPGSGGLTSPHPARAVLVVGSSRGGVAVLDRALHTLGLHAPATASWVTDFHDRLLQQVNVRALDARPQAWFETGRLGTQEMIRRELFEWVQTEVGARTGEMVIADPRLAWFLSLWKAAALRCEVDASYAVVLRSPAEEIRSTADHRAGHASTTSQAAGWINHVLHTERATRGSRRALVPHEDLLEDWTVPLYRLGERFGLKSVHNAGAREIRGVHALIDSRPPAPRITWSDTDVPGPLQTLVDESWDQLTKLARADDDPADVLTTLDELRRAYTQLYDDSERIARSSIVAARRARSRRPSDTSVPAPETPPATTPWRRLLERRSRAR